MYILQVNNRKLHTRIVRDVLIFSLWCVRNSRFDILILILQQSFIVIKLIKVGADMDSVQHD